MGIHKVVENAPRSGQYKNTPEGGVDQSRTQTNDHVAALLLDRPDISEVRLTLADGTVKTYCRSEDVAEVSDEG